MTTVYLSLGGNQGAVADNLKEALRLLRFQEGIANLQSSRFFVTSPVEMKSTHTFINCACVFETTFSLLQLFSLLQEIEKTLGKQKKAKNEDRPIDIDILFFGDQFFQQEDLQVPHPRWKERLFVLIPLADLVPEITLHSPDGTKTYILKDMIQELLSRDLCESCYFSSSNV